MMFTPFFNFTFEINQIFDIPARKQLLLEIRIKSNVLCFIIQDFIETTSQSQGKHLKSVMMQFNLCYL